VVRQNKAIDWQRDGWKELEMPLLSVFAFRFVRLLLSGHQVIAIENAACAAQKLHNALKSAIIS